MTRLISSAPMAARKEGREYFDQVHCSINSAERESLQTPHAARRNVREPGSTQVQI